ncbi:hypothetical protein ASC94_31270 [Massilia sp. Root418]|nr:hypothetical protein ASC94_31270 [Massilia sp. Root418]
MTVVDFAVEAAREHGGQHGQRVGAADPADAGRGLFQLQQPFDQFFMLARGGDEQWRGGGQVFFGRAVE